MTSVTQGESKLPSNNPTIKNKNNKPIPKSSIDYLQELLKDKRKLVFFPNIFSHVQRLLEDEIDHVRSEAFHNSEQYKITQEDLPTEEGEKVTVQMKVFVPIKEHPAYNFVGRLLGPAGMTAKQLEKDLDCKIMIRGKGSMRDKTKEEQNKGKPNWEHLDEELHVLVSVEDTPHRADIKVRRAAENIEEFFNEALRTPEKEDKLKQMQLMELAYKNAMNRVSWPNTGQQTPLSPSSRSSRLGSAMINVMPQTMQPTQQQNPLYPPPQANPVSNNASNGLHMISGDITSFLNSYAQLFTGGGGSDYLYTTPINNGLYDYNNALASSLNSSCGLYRTGNMTAAALPPQYYTTAQQQHPLTQQAHLPQQQQHNGHLQAHHGNNEL